MDFIVRLIIGVVGVAAGVIIMSHNYQLTQLFGYNSFAERYLGTAGTYAMWKLLGLALVIGSIVYVF